MSSLFHCPTKKKFSWNGSTSVACSIPIQKTRTVLLWRIGRQFDGNGDKLALIWPIDDDYKSWKHRRERHCKSKRKLSISFASSRWNYNKIKVFLQIIPRAFSSAPMVGTVSQMGGTVSQTNCPLNFGPKIRIIFSFSRYFFIFIPRFGEAKRAGPGRPLLATWWFVGHSADKCAKITRWNHQEASTPNASVLNSRNNNLKIDIWIGILRR